MDAKLLCENCGKEISGREYKDEQSIVETHYECPYCGFRRHWAYGHILPEDSEYEKTEDK